MCATSYNLTYFCYLCASINIFYNDEKAIIFRAHIAFYHVLFRQTGPQGDACSRHNSHDGDANTEVFAALHGRSTRA